EAETLSVVEGSIAEGSAAEGSKRSVDPERSRGERSRREPACTERSRSAEGLAVLKISSPQG
ncbi:hypothetical protein MYX04_15425, partial [Nitrospiraceae bacterium AH_259_D15_M11_P09]|nr:hypothetical protein [Nitrospiraceae bacterium AH_259_D15_M11_P09]